MNAGSLAQSHRWVHVVASLGLATLAALGLGVGCSDGGSGGGSGFNPSTAPPIAQADYCASKANVYCGIVLPCCQAVGYPTDRGKCQDAMLASCQSEVSTKTAAGRAYDARAAGVCLGGLPSVTTGCKESANDPAATAIGDACDRIWVGAVPIGGTCASSTDCAAASDGSTVYCSAPATPGDGGTSGGKCTVQPVAKLGEACGTNTDAGATYVSCVTGLSCLYVAGAGVPGSSHCVQLGDVGAQCHTGSDCKSALYCDSTTLKCASPAPVGAACAPNDTSSCATGGYCDQTAKKCVALPGAGAPCATFAYPQCAADSSCDATSKLCVAKKGNGQACSTSSECLSGYCGGTATSTAKACNPDPGIASASTCAVANGAAPPF